MRRIKDRRPLGNQPDRTPVRRRQWKFKGITNKSYILLLLDDVLDVHRYPAKLRRTGPSGHRIRANLGARRRRHQRRTSQKDGQS